jgi:hypothetical protein
MQDGDDADGIRIDALKNGVGEAPDEQSAETAMERRKQGRLLGDAIECVVDDANEVFAQAGRALLIPIVRSQQVGDGGRSRAN